MTLAARSKEPARQTSKSTAKKPASSQHCWPGFEPQRGKAAGEKGSCRPKAGKQSKSVRRQDQKRAAANILGKKQRKSA